MNNKFLNMNSAQEGENTTSTPSQEGSHRPPGYSPFQSTNAETQKALRADIKATFSDIPSEQADAMIKEYYLPVRSNDPAKQDELELEAILEMASDPIAAPSPQPSSAPVENPPDQYTPGSIPDDFAIQDPWGCGAIPETQDWVAPSMDVALATQTTTPSDLITYSPSQITGTEILPAEGPPAQALPVEVIPNQTVFARTPRVQNVYIGNITIQTAPAESTPTQSGSTESAAVQIVPTKNVPAQPSSTRNIAAQEAKKAIALGLFEHIAQPPDFSIAPDEVNNEYDLLETAASKIRFVHVNDHVHWYNGRYYEQLDDAVALGTILSACRDEIKTIGRFPVLKNAYQFLKIDLRFKAPEEWVEYGGDYVTFFNGNLNWRTGEFVPHSPSIFTTYTVKANYLGPTCPDQPSRFIEFLFQAGGGSAEWVERALAMIGYCLVPDLSGRCAFLLQGKSAGGKSLISRFVSSFFPEEKVAALSAHELTNDFAAAELKNAAICVTPDMPATPLEEKAVGRIKALSGLDLVHANRKHKDFTKFYFTGKFIMCSNHALLTHVSDPAFDSRIVALPFLYSTPPEKQDPDLLRKFQLERDYVASCAINCYFKLRNNHYRFAGDFRMNMQDALEGSSENVHGMVVDFVVNNCVADPDGSVYTAAAWSLFQKLYGIDIDLATFGGYFKDAISIFSEVKSLRKRATNSKNPSRCYKGIALKSQGGDPHAL